MKYTNEQILEELHQDTVDIQADIWENEKKWFEMQENGIIEVGEPLKLTPKAEVKYEYNTGEIH